MTQINNNTAHNTIQLRLKQSIQPIVMAMTVLTQCACSTVYYHNDYENPPAADLSLTHKQTQHDGWVTLFTESPSVELETTCGPNGWQTIKTESNWVDLIIRAVANPIWGTFTIEYECKDHALAQAPEDTQSKLETHLLP